MARTGYTEPVVDYAFDALFGEIRAAALRAAIASELGSLEALERFVARDGRPDVRYAPLERVAILSSETTLGVALPALAFALCAGSRVMVKDRNDGLIAAFGRTLSEERPDVGARLRVASWDSSEAAAGDSSDGDFEADVRGADAVVAYGRNETLAVIRARLKPEARFFGFGHRTSAGYVAREALCDERAAREAARAAARDALLYDGQGCLSMHALFVESDADVTPRAFARLLAAACDEVATEFPAGFLEPDPDVAAYRRAALFRASQGSGEVLAGVTSPHLLVLDPPHDLPPPLLRRTLALYSTASPDEALAFLRRHALPLEAVAFAAEPRADLEAFALATGASRVAPLGLLQQPPLGGDHGGAGRILPFVRAIYRG
jgi:hypothetical protein